MSERPAHSLPPDYFARKYAADPDPWDFATSAYEADKYAATLNALPAPRYRQVLELGCSIGVLTERLADRADALLALDVVEEALAQARRRCAHLPHVVFARRAVPAAFPGGRFDLVLMSEVGYYLNRDDLCRTVELVTDALLPGGHFLLVHWTPGATDYPLTGDQVHDLALRHAGPRLRHCSAARAATYRLDLLERTPE
jgi:SAM-dependent methyltransferase